MEKPPAAAGRTGESMAGLLTATLTQTAPSYAEIDAVARAWTKEKHAAGVSVTPALIKAELTPRISALFRLEVQ